MNLEHIQSRRSTTDIEVPIGACVNTIEHGGAVDGCQLDADLCKWSLRVIASKTSLNASSLCNSVPRPIEGNRLVQLVRTAAFYYSDQTGRLDRSQVFDAISARKQAAYGYSALLIAFQLQNVLACLVPNPSYDNRNSFNRLAVILNDQVKVGGCDEGSWEDATRKGDSRTNSQHQTHQRGLETPAPKARHHVAQGVSPG